MPKIAHSEAYPAATAVQGSPDRTTRVATETAERGADAARKGMQAARRAATALGETQGETARRSAAGMMEFSRLFFELLNEQTRHNVQVATAFGPALDWCKATQIQSEFVRDSFERMSQLNRRYLEVIQTMMRSPAFTAGNQSERAA